MDRIRGDIKMVGNLTGGGIRTHVDEYGRTIYLGSHRAASILDALQIGNTTLMKARCPAEVYNALDTGRNVCVYVFRTLFRAPLILGVLDAGTGKKTMMSREYYRGTLLQMAIVHALLNGIGAWIAGMIIGIVIGLGQSSVPPVLGLLAGLGGTWWMTFQFRKDYHEALADQG